MHNRPKCGQDLATAAGRADFEPWERKGKSLHKKMNGKCINFSQHN